MSTYTIPSREIPLDDSWDVIVLGGGPTGSTAAAAAAREGAKTLLVEATGSLGGSGTSSLVPAWCPFSDKEKIIYKGLAETVLERCKAHQPHVKAQDLDWVPIDAERLKVIYDDLVTEFGVSVLFHTFFSAVETDGEGRIETVLISNKAGLTALRAKVFIDCTGDADLCAWAGAEFQQGDETGDLMPATHCFILANVDEYGLSHGEWLHGNNKKSPIYDVLESGKYPLIIDAHACNNIVGPGTVGFNAGHLWDLDNTDPWSLSRGMMKGRKIARQYQEALAEFHPKAFANAFLVMTGSTMGIRETRRVIGDYVLTLDDYLERRSFDDEICRNSYYIDIHHAKKDVEANVKNRREGVEARTFRYGVGESHGVPYRCLTPKGLKNVLVAGRSISCDRVVQGSVRVMPVCLAMGEAAGIAAVLAYKTADGDAHGVDVTVLREKLREYGAYLP
jgi:hypothetical protein